MSQRRGIAKRRSTGEKNAQTLDFSIQMPFVWIPKSEGRFCANRDSFRVSSPVIKAVAPQGVANFSSFASQLIASG